MSVYAPTRSDTTDAPANIASEEIFFNTLCKHFPSLCVPCMRQATCIPKGTTTSKGLSSSCVMCAAMAQKNPHLKESCTPCPPDFVFLLLSSHCLPRLGSVLCNYAVLERFWPSRRSVCICTVQDGASTVCLGRCHQGRPPYSTFLTVIWPFGSNIGP